MVMLRKQGHSVPEISTLTGRPQSTVYRHVSRISILPQFQERWMSLRNGSRVRAERNWRIAKEHATTMLNDFSRRDIALVVASLYWAEGSKKDFGLTNSDPRLIRVFMDGLRRVFALANDDFTISLRIYEDLNRDRCLSYWSHITDISLGPTTSVNVLAGSKQGKLAHGMCRVRVKKGGMYLKEIVNLIDLIDLDIVRPRSSMDRTVAS